MRLTKLIPIHSAAAYGVAAVLAGAAALMRSALLHPLSGESLCAAPFYPAVLAAAFLGGAGAGFVALALSFGALVWLVPSGGIPAVPLQTAELWFYGGATTLILMVAASLRTVLERLEMAQEHLVSALEASGTGTWRWHLRSRMVEWDPALIHLFGLTAEEAPTIQSDFARLIHPDDHAHVRQTIRKAVVDGVADYEFRALLPDGTVRWMYTRSRMVRDGKGGAPGLMIGTCLDVTERKRAQERQNLLVHELNHRVKNTLSIVQSLALQTIRGSGDLHAFREVFQARLLALSAAHNILTQELWESACMRDILSAELNPFGGLDEHRVRATGEPIRLTPQQALGFGMAFHELATNAVKHGSLSAQQGSIDIAWRTGPDADGNALLHVDWIERDGPPVAEPARKGFGSRLIERSICSELDGALLMRFEPAGLNCSFSVPL